MITAALALFLLGQQAPFTQSIEVRIHNVDVIVTDKDGNAVGGLRRDDFVLLQDGKAQTITNFSEYAERAAPAPSVDSSSAAPTDSVQRPPQRTIVFFVDDITLHPATREKLAKNAAGLLASTMREGDVAMVLRPAASVSEKIPLVFSDDRAAVGAALNQAVVSNTYRTDVAFVGEMRRFQLEARHAISEQELRQIARRHAARVKRRVELRLQALRAIIATLAPLPGRKILITVTESLPAEPGKEFFRAGNKIDNIATASFDSFSGFDTSADFLRTDWYDFTPAIEELARTASSNGITIYTLQPEYDLRVSPPGEGVSDEGTDVSVHQVQEAMTNTGKTSAILTGKTGGKSFVGDARVDDALNTIARDVQAYYSLAFRASDDLDTPHRVEVRVRNHPEWSVRARNEVVRKSIKREMNDRVVAALMTTNLPNDFGVAARAGKPVPAKKRGLWNVDLEVLFPIGRLTLLPEGNVYRGRYTVHYAITGSATDFVSGSDAEQLVEIPAAEYEAARTKAWGHTLHLTMQRGDHQIAVGVLDGVGQTSGMATLDVNIK
jgi:VWFA-related protein